MIPDGLVLESPLQIIFLSTAARRRSCQARGRWCSPASGANRASSRPTSGRRVTYFTNAVTEVAVGENAIVDHYKVQEEAVDAFHIAAMHVHAARSATFSSHAFSLGGKLARNDIFAVLDGEGAECTLNGLYLADGERLVDTHTTIDHAKPHCPSHEVYKGILGGRARAVFNGKIIVRPDAQKTDAKQTNRALLLTDDATINTKPQLEIFADDVKCTHGAAIGQLDEDAMFYLREPRPDVRRGPRHADPRICRRDSRPCQGRAAAPRARSRALRAAGHRIWPRSTPHDDHCCRADAAPAFDVERVRADFPILRRAGPWQAARLSRQRGDDAEAAGGASTRSPATTRTSTPTCTAACTS